MSESCHAQLRKVLPLLLLLLSSPSPSIPLKWYFIVLAVSADTADTHVTNAASMLDNGNNWMPIYVKYNWDFIEIMPLIRLDSAAVRSSQSSVICSWYFCSSLCRMLSYDPRSCPSAPRVWESSNRTPCVTTLCSIPVNRYCIVKPIHQQSAWLHVYKYIHSLFMRRHSIFAMTCHHTAL